jgi:hypothetical protein
MENSHVGRKRGGVKMKAMVKIMGTSIGLKLQKIVFIWVVLVLIGNVCFSAENKYEEMKRHYRGKNFSAVVSIFKNMSAYDRKHLSDDNEKEILLMAARSMAEMIRYQSEIDSGSWEIKSIFYRLLELNHDITINDLHIPGNKKEIFLESFREAYKKLFGKLVIKIGKPAVDIKIDGQYKFTTQKGNEPVELFLWVGLNKIYKAYEVTLEYDSPKYEESKPYKVLIMPGKVKHLRVKFKRKLTRKRNYLLLALEQNVGMYSKRFDDKFLKYTSPLRDISAFEFGIGVSETTHFSVKYGKNYNLFIPENKWQGKDINEYLDYNITHLEVNLGFNKIHASVNPKRRVSRVGYKYFKIENVDYLGNKLTSTYYLFANDFFYNSRSNRRNAIFIQLGGGYFLGAAKIDINYNQILVSPTFTCVGVSAYLELCGSLNRRFDISIGTSFEFLYSGYNGDKYDWLPEEMTSDFVFLLKGFSRLTFRF